MANVSEKKVRKLIEIVTKEEGGSRSQVPVYGDKTGYSYRGISQPIAPEREYVYSNRRRLSASDKLTKLRNSGNLDSKLVIEATHALSAHEGEMKRIRKARRTERKKSFIRISVFAGVLTALSYLGVRGVVYEEKKRDEQSFIWHFENAVRFRGKYKQELEKIRGPNIESASENPNAMFIERLMRGLNMKISSEDFYIGWIERLDSEIGYLKEDVKKKMSSGYRPILRERYEKNFGSESWWPE